MRVLLISANTEVINMITIPVGLGAVAAATKQAGHQVEFLDLMNEKDPASLIEKSESRFNPQVIGISVRNIDDQEMAGTKFLLDKAREIVSICRRYSSAPIVLGGAGYSIFPEAALEYLDADMGIQGDGESAFITLLGRIENGADVSDIPGLHIKGQKLQSAPAFTLDLDKLPIPDANLWLNHYDPANEQIYMPIQTRRGCPMACSYCSTSLIEGTNIRKRSVDKVVDALAAYEAVGFKRIHFVDNTFNMPYSYAMKLCRRIVDRGLNIHSRCILYPKHMDEPLIKTMAEAGVREAALGFESGCEATLEALNKKFNLDEVRQISKLLGDYKIFRMGFLMMGGPAETKETVIESMKFADSLKIEMMNLTAGIRIYPDTPLAKVAVADGIISPDDNLLQPRFYIVPQLNGWLQDTIKEWAATRRNWII